MSVAHRDKPNRSLQSRRLALALVGLMVAPLPAAATGQTAQTASTTSATDPAPGQPAQGAKQFVASVGDKVIGILKAHPDDKIARAKALHAVFKDAFDVTGMARFAAGLYWRRTQPAEREKYVKLFGDYIANLYAVKFSGYQGQTFAVTDARAAGDDVTAVQTKIVSSDKSTPVQFRVRKTGNQFQVVDVYVAGVSMLITKRDEFNTVLAREGMQGLMQRLKETASG